MAATTIAAALNALAAPMGAANMVHNHGHVQINFNQQCVINTDFTRRHGASVTGYAQGITVGVNETLRGNPNKRSFSIYHLVGTF